MKVGIPMRASGWIFSMKRTLPSVPMTLPPPVERVKVL
jgi:hypothetical protein